MTHLQHSPLGQTTQYTNKYQPDLLFPVARKNNRKQIGINGQLPFVGFDQWNAFEISWLNAQGKPIVAMGRFTLPCVTPYLVESKSIKLYLNSLNGTSFVNWQQVQNTIAKGLSKAAGGEVKVELIPIEKATTNIITHPNGICIDDLPVAIQQYQVDPTLLKVKSGSSIVTETIYSNLLKSNCPITQQPDWGTISINYQGPQIIHESLLKYIVSYREHPEFHEQCVERMFVDIQKYCNPKQLTIYARYTRRGGLDINPYRSTHVNFKPELTRLIRQ